VLLEKYLADPAQAQAVKQAIVTELQQVLDHRRTPTNVLKEVGGGRVEFDPELQSSFTLKNLDGTPRRDVVVPGVVIGQHTFKQLTEAALIKEMDVA
jgi:hypothetical protein